MTKFQFEQGLGVESEVMQQRQIRPEPETVVEPDAPLEQVATVTRVVGNDLVYAIIEGIGLLVFTPDKIKGYKGEPLKLIGIVKGAQIEVTVDRVSQVVLAVEEKEHLDS